MEARSRNLGFGFPGYDGNFPKATRSLRGRADHTVRKSLETEASDLPKDMCFFELLATVAGQLLQEQDGETLKARSLVDLEAPKMNAASVLDSSIGCGINSCLKNGSGTANQAKKEEIITATKDPNHLRHKSDKCYEPSAPNFCFHDNSDPLHGQKQDMKPLEEPIKAYASRKRKSSGAVSCQGSATVSSINRHVKTESGERVTPRSDHCTPKANGDLPLEMVSAQFINLKETISLNKQEGVVDQCCNPQCLAPFQDIESPLLVSSGSSEETAFPLEPNSYSTVAFESNRKNEVREEFSSWKIGDDDENSSESTIPKSLLTKSSSMSYNRTMKARRCTNSTARRRGLGLGSKRKCHEMEDGENEKARLGKKKLSKLPLLKGGIEQSNDSPLGMLVDTEPEDKFDGSPINSEREKTASIMSSPITSSPTKRDDTNVKLSIKSFMVPELMVALPESATVAHLKKAVMEAAMNLLGGGLCVRVLLQGKKVTDEAESLLQAGISGGGKSDSLGFMLEPNPFPASAGVEDTFLVLSHNANQTSSRYPVLSKGSEINTGSYHVGTSEGLLEIDANSSGTEMQSTTVSPTKEDGLVHDSNGLVIPGRCALVLHSSQANNGPNGLAVVPFGQSSGSIGINKRRIRRPFSVAEVEVLVQAVEKLGTGRWRDVKLHAFPQAKHRTYVDLKDKWKTLVHTASIAPHQRRGEPVPQGLLDRVIHAHSYWTAQQAKQQSMETKVF